MRLRVVVDWGGGSWRGSPLQVADPLDRVAGMFACGGDGVVVMAVMVG